METLYDIYFAGELVDGFAEPQVRDSLAALFKAGEDTLEKLFSGKAIAIKRGVDEATASRYRGAMRKAGAVVSIREAIADKPSTATSTNPAPTMSMAPLGSEILNEEERAPDAHAEVDTSGIKMENTFMGDEAPPASAVPSPPDTSHLSLVGEDDDSDIPHIEYGRTPLKPETDHLTIAQAGEEIPNLPPTETPLDPDTSALSLADSGSDVLEEEYRRQDEPPAPDTGHISLADE
jgi:hypothetical protein